MIGCSNEFCATTWWESKYKTCRAAFVAMGRIYNVERKAASKDRQRIIELCNEGLGHHVQTRLTKDQCFARILQILNVAGY